MDLYDLSQKKLRKLSESLGLDSTGVKSDLIKRIMEEKRLKEELDASTEDEVLDVSGCFHVF